MGPKARGAVLTPEIQPAHKVPAFTIEEHCQNAGAAFHSASIAVDDIMEAF